MVKVPRDAAPQLERACKEFEQHKDRLEQLKLRRSMLEARASELRRDLNAVIRDSQQLVASVLRLRGHRGTAEWQLMTTCGLRIAALGSVFLHQDISGPDDVIDFAPALRQISQDVNAQLGRPSVGLRCTIEPVRTTVRRAQHLALIANELVVNAYQHAFTGRRFGAIEVGARAARGRRGLLWVVDNGVGASARALDGSGGWHVVRALAETLDAELSCTDMRPGTRIDVGFHAA